MEERLTNGLHDQLWIKGARALPQVNLKLQEIEAALRVGNSITCVKELHSLGQIDDETYKTSLLYLMEKSGFKLK